MIPLWQGTSAPVAS